MPASEPPAEASGLTPAGLARLSDADLLAARDAFWDNLAFCGSTRSAAYLHVAICLAEYERRRGTGFGVLLALEACPDDDFGRLAIERARLAGFAYEIRPVEQSTGSVWYYMHIKAFEL